MNVYELTVVLPEKATSAKIKSFQESLDKTLKALKGSIKKSKDWGKIDLAYSIKGNLAGTFIHYDLELDQAAVKSLGDKLRMNDGVVRYLLITKEG